MVRVVQSSANQGQVVIQLLQLFPSSFQVCALHCGAPQIPNHHGSSRCFCSSAQSAPLLLSYLPTFASCDVPQRTAAALAAAGGNETAVVAAVAGACPGPLAAERAVRYGSNEMEIPVKSIPKLIFEEMWHAFYVFQVGSF